MIPFKLFRPIAFIYFFFFFLLRGYRLGFVLAMANLVLCGCFKYFPKGASLFVMTLMVKEHQPLSEVLHWLRGRLPDSHSPHQAKRYTIAHLFQRQMTAGLRSTSLPAQREQEREADLLPSKKVEVTKTLAC